ncbi:MAG: hypothetical protein MHPSP_002607, partial [Paramarteilia canceri]
MPDMMSGAETDLHSDLKSGLSIEESMKKLKVSSEQCSKSIFQQNVAEIKAKISHFENVKSQLEIIKTLKDSFAACKEHLTDCCDYIDNVKQDVDGVLSKLKQVQMVKSEFNSFIADSKISQDMI